jgi:hypothetical protein
VHVQTAKIGSLVDIQDSEDPEGLRVFYYLIQDLRVGLECCLGGTSLTSASSVSYLLAHLATFQDPAHIEALCVLSL